MLNLIHRFITAPSTNGEKLVRDFIILTVGTVLGFIAEKATGIAASLNDATGDRIPAVLIAAGLSGILWLYRAFRAWSTKPATPPTA